LEYIFVASVKYGFYYSYLAYEDIRMIWISQSLGSAINIDKIRLRVQFLLVLTQSSSEKSSGQVSQNESYTMFSISVLLNPCGYYSTIMGAKKMALPSCPQLTVYCKTKRDINPFQPGVSKWTQFCRRGVRDFEKIRTRKIDPYN